MVVLPAGLETNCSLDTVSAGLGESIERGRFGAEGCQGQGRRRLEGGGRAGCQPCSPPPLAPLFTGIGTRGMS